MRKFIDIINETFGSATLSRNTDAAEVIDFKVFCLKEEDVASLKAITSRFDDMTCTVRAPSPNFRKWTLLCRGTRKDAEAVQRGVKMARVEGGITRID